MQTSSIWFTAFLSFNFVKGPTTTILSPGASDWLAPSSLHPLMNPVTYPFINSFTHPFSNHSFLPFFLLSIDSRVYHFNRSFANSPANPNPGGTRVPSLCLHPGCWEHLEKNTVRLGTSVVSDLDWAVSVTCFNHSVETGPVRFTKHLPITSANVLYSLLSDHISASLCMQLWPLSLCEHCLLWLPRALGSRLPL